MEAENELGEGVKPPEKSFWAKYVSNVLCSIFTLLYYVYVRDQPSSRLAVYQIYGLLLVGNL